jgi:two-component system sensor histidine kinase BaeS
MKTKFFLAFLIVILTALLSTFLFERLITRDFENYVRGVQEDQLYWITTSAESSYERGKWNHTILSETVHWAMMMGLDTKILNTHGDEIISSHRIIQSLSPVMQKRMEGLFQIDKTRGVFQDYPLYSEGQIIGTLSTRPFQKQEIAEKEVIFQKRMKNFLLISLLIAGIGSLIIALFLSRYLSKPIADLKLAAEKVAQGDFGVRTNKGADGEIGKLSEMFNKMAESLEREEKLRQQLLSNIAHELRTPLTIMKTQLEGLSDGIITDRAKALKNLDSEMERLIKLVKGIEDVTTAEASFFRRLDETDCNLREFLSGIVDDMRPLFKEKNLSLTLREEKDFSVTVDAEKLETIVRNLLSNALKFTEEGTVSVRYGKNLKKFFIEIQDTGTGISEESIPLIFNRFYKGQKSSAQGLGLGLAIVKELSDIMQGEVTVKSKLGEGSIFTIFLPLSTGSY